MARSLAKAAVTNEFGVIAGLANGIDATAQETALDADGRVIGFIGTRIDRYHPTQNRSLQNRVAKEGVLYSQFYPSSAPTRYSFPIRNASMSEYEIATVVVAAGEYSGMRLRPTQHKNMAEVLFL